MVRHHLLSVWNPIYTANAMEAHLRVLQDAVRKFRGGRLREDDVYVWWGKVRSANRLQPMPHLSDVLAIQTEIDRNDPAPETHVYLTDFSSLYVAHLGQISTEDPRADRGEQGHVPAYYRKEKLNCDFWFRLWDVRRLVANDMPMVLRELQLLRNVRHDDRPVSIYGGMVDLPLIVTESRPQRFFDPLFRQTYAGGPFWIEFDSERSGVGAVERDLRENLFGDEAWHAFGPATRLFIATGEKLYREHSQDPNFDFSAVLVEFAKAVEVRCNELLPGALNGAPQELRYYNRDGRGVEIGMAQPQNLGELARFIGGDRLRVDYLNQHLDNGRWFTGQLPPILEELASLRNPAAHSGTVFQEDARRWRNRLCGVGGMGLFLELARVRRK